MTREQAIQHLLKFAEENKYKSDEMGFLSGLMNTALSNPWHKVSEELPKEIKYAENTLQGRREWTESQIVLTIDNHYLPSVDCLKNGEWMKLRSHPRDCDGFPIEYLYWMPIPKIKED